MPVTPEMIREVFTKFGRIVDMRAGMYAAAIHPTYRFFLGPPGVVILDEPNCGTGVSLLYGFGLSPVRRCTGAKDFVFIDYDDIESCFKAVDAMNGKTFDEHSRGVMKVSARWGGCDSWATLMFSLAGICCSTVRTASTGPWAPWWSFSVARSWNASAS